MSPREPRSAEVVALRGGTPSDPDVVRQLERLLDLARKGDIQGVVWGAVRRDRAYLTGHAAANGYVSALAAPLLVVTRRLGHYLHEGAPEVPDL